MRACDVELHVARAGDGPPVILLHGFPENWTSWRHQIPALVGAGFSVLAPDMRGYNESDRPADVTEYRLRLLIDDVAELIRGSGHRRAHIVGHDWGGVIAWTFAGAYPDMVDKLVIMNAPHLHLYRKALKRPGQLLRSWYVGMFQLPRVAEAMLSRNDYAVLRRIFTRGPARPGTFTTEDVEQYVAAARRPGALTAMLNYYRALRDPGSSAIGRAARAEAETLIIWGHLDRALSPRLLDGIEDMAPVVHIHRIPTAGHWVQNEAPAEVNRTLVEFLLAPPTERS
jgi:epoxide hydrolase 4